MRKVTPAWFYGAVLLTLVASLFSLRYRVAIESRNQRTTLAMDYGLIELSTPVGRSVAESLGKAREAGLGAVTISEITVDDALANGTLRIERRGEQLVVTGDVPLLKRALGSAGFKPIPPVSSDGSVTLPASTYVQLRALSLGLPETAVANAKAAGLRIVARLSNPPSATLESIRATLANARSAGAWAYLPQGEQVLGQRDIVPEVANILREQGWLYCSAEFTKISGDEKLSAKLADKLLRLHSIQTAEVDKLSPSEFMERFVKAARERNIRVLLVRPMSSASVTELAGITDTLKALRNNLGKEGILTGDARPFSDASIPRALFVLIGFGIALAGLFVLQSISEDSRVQIVGSLALVVIAALALTEHRREIPALFAAILFPCAAYLWLEQASGKINALFAYGFMSIVSLVGGLSGAALLNGLDYYVKIEQFSGVKLAHLIPILFIGALLIGRRVSFQSVMASPVRWGGIAAMFGCVVLLAVMVMRTGNDNPAGVSGLELKLRSMMDWLFYARPRTKEIFFGHPAMVVGLFAWFASRKGGSARAEWIGIALVILGAIGQTSIVNTFSHLHTPLLLSLARVGIGWVIGGLIGCGIWLIVRPWILGREALSVA